MKQALQDLYCKCWRQGGKSTRTLTDGTDGGFRHGRTLGHPDSAGCARGSDRQDMRTRSIQHVHDLPKKALLKPKNKMVLAKLEDMLLLPRVSIPRLSTSFATHTLGLRRGGASGRSCLHDWDILHICL